IFKSVRHRGDIKTRSFTSQKYLTITDKINYLNCLVNRYPLRVSLKCIQLLLRRRVHA
ncbi:hypothetical protein L9F63_017756, partial [Diploptera punctata]